MAPAIGATESLHFSFIFDVLFLQSASELLLRSLLGARMSNCPQSRDPHLLSALFSFLVLRFLVGPLLPFCADLLLSFLVPCFWLVVWLLTAKLLGEHKNQLRKERATSAGTAAEQSRARLWTAATTSLTVSFVSLLVASKPNRLFKYLAMAWH